MKNWEKYKDDILKITISGRRCAVNKNGEVIPCESIVCNNCLCRGVSCRDEFRIWCNEEYGEPKIQEEVKHCKIDDKIMASSDGVNWIPEHFCSYDVCNNNVISFGYGRTSFTGSTDDTSRWKYARLPEEDEL